MSNDQMRAILKKVYPGKKWTDKVNAMKDNQVYALYMKFLNSGKLKGL